MAGARITPCPLSDGQGDTRDTQESCHIPCSALPIRNSGSRMGAALKPAVSPKLSSQDLATQKLSCPPWEQKSLCQSVASRSLELLGTQSWVPNPQGCTEDCTALVAAFPSQDPHLAAQTLLFISLPRENKVPPPLQNPMGTSVLRKSVWFVQQLPLPTLPAPETLSERRKTPGESLPKYQSAVQSPREERFSSPAEAAVNKHSTCFISCQGCPLLSTELTPAPRWKRRQEPEAHQ